jgi:hypothetical protein
MVGKHLRHRLMIDALKRGVSSVVLAAYAVSMLTSGDFAWSPFSMEKAEAAAGINKVINYQGKVSSIGGSAVANGSYNIRFKIFDASANGNELWSESWTNSTTRVTMTGGLFSVALGTHTSIATLNFNADNLYLQVEFDPGNDGIFEEVFSPRRRFGSVPYAFNTDTIDGLDSTDFIRKNQQNIMTGSITINNTTSTALTVRGALSGAIIHASTNLSTSGSLTVKGAVQFKNYTSCAIIATDSNGNLGCGSATTNTGSVIAITNGRYVNTAGDTMTGALIIDDQTNSGPAFTASGSNSPVGVIQNMAGAVSYLQFYSNATGTNGLNDGLTIGYNGAGWIYNREATALNFGTSNALRMNIGATGNVAIGGQAAGSKLSVSGSAIIGASIGTAAADAGVGLEVIGTISGSTLYANNALRSSGSLVWEGAASGASLYVASSIQGAGLADCDLTNSQLKWDTTTGRFSCGTLPNEVGTVAFSGAVLRMGDTRYVNTFGDTMTGALVINITNGLRGTVGLNVVNTISGAVIRAQKTLASSGTLVWEGVASGASLWVSTFDGAGLTDCDLTNSLLKWDATTDRFSCGTIANEVGTVAFSGAVLRLGDNRYVRKAGDTMTGALTINLSSGFIGLEVMQTISGSYIHAENGLNSSGGLVVEYSGTASSAASSGAVAVIQRAENETGAYIYSSGSVLALDTYSKDGATKHILFGYRGTFDTNLYRNGSSMLRTDGTFTAGTTLASSGTLVWEGAASGSSLYVASSIQGAGLVDCDLSSSQLKWDATTGRFSCGTISTGTNTGNVLAIGDARYVKKSGDTMTGALTINVTGGVRGTVGLNVLNTISGAVIRAQKTLASSGTLVVEGTMSGNALHVMNNSYFMGNLGIGTNNPTSDLTIGSSDIATASLTGTNGSQLELNQGLNGGTVSYRDSTGFIVNTSSTTTFQLDTVSALELSYVNGTPLIAATGNLSGSSLLTLSSYRTCTLKTTATGMVICGTDLTGGGSSSFSTGNVLTIGDARYVKKSGDTMTGKLTINLASGTLGLNVLQTISGSVIHAEKTLSSSGTLVWEGAASGASLYVASSLQGAGLVDCDAALTSKLLWDSTTGRFTCGTDQSGGGAGTPEVGTLSFSGAVIRLGDTRYLRTSGGTLTGALTIQNGNTHTNTATPLLVVRGVMSGTILRAQMGLASSGTLVWEGAGSGQALNLGGGNTTVSRSGALVWNEPGNNIDFRLEGDTNQALFFLDASVDRIGIGTRTPKTIFDVAGTMSGNSLVVSKTAFFSGSGIKLSSTGAATFNEFGNNVDFRIESDTNDAMFVLDASANRIGIGTRMPKAFFDIVGTMSGARVFASTLLSTSGALMIESMAKAGSGAATVIGFEYQTGAYLYSSGATALALETYTQSGAKAPHIMFGYRGTFDAAITRQSTGSLTFSSQTGVLLRLNSERNTTGDVFDIVSDFSSDENKVFRIQADGTVYSDNAYNSTGADYAEWFYSSDNLKSGEVVCIDVTRNNAVKRCGRDADGNVMGIVSTNPAFIGNRISGADGLMPPGYVLVGLIGQVPAKVIVENEEGIIRPGDSLTAASKAGYARKAKAGESTVGVALEGQAYGEGTVNVLISRRNQSLTVETVEEKVLKTITDMQIEDEVQLMVAGAMGDLNVDAQITSEVERQLNGMKTQEALIQNIQAEITALKEELARIKSQTGSTTVMQSTGSGMHLAATSLEIASTLTTGGNARIGGDLHIDGALTASSLFVPQGLTIDGGTVINGDLISSMLTVTGDAHVAGTLTIGGTLNFASGSVIDLSAATINMKDLVVENALYVMGDVTIEGLATFLRNVEVKGELIVSDKHAGFAMVPKGATGVTIHFSSGYTETPVVTATPNGPVRSAWWLSVPTQTGFTINVSIPVEEDTLFSWIALSTGKPLTVFALVNESSSMVFPLDDKGVPVASSMAWNACIRGIPMFDSEGIPLSCSRYHDSYTWTHPDLNISFVWNTSMNPPYLKVPEGYTPTITESSSSIVNAIGGNASDELTEEEPVTEEPAPATGTGTTVTEPVVTEPTPETPTEEPATEPVTEPTTETPAEEPVAEPVVEPVTETPAEAPAAETPAPTEPAPETPAAEQSQE